MEIFFTPTPVEQLASYIKEHYPYCDVGLIGDFATLSPRLEKGGNRVFSGRESFPESVRIIVAVGGEREVEEAKKFGLPYVVFATELSLSLIHNFGIYDFQKIEKGYPNAVFIEKDEDGRRLRAEVEILHLALLAECLNLIGSVERCDRAKKARETLLSLAEFKASFHTDEEWFLFIKDAVKEMGGLEYVAFLFSTLGVYHPENVFHARYYSLFSLLYLIRLFTKIDFCVILPRVDLCRVRMLAEVQGIKVPPQFNLKTPSFIPVLPTGCIPTERELMESLSVFRFCAGNEEIDFDAMLSSIILSATLRPKKEMVGYFVDMGYLDALLNPNERGDYASNR